MAATNDKYEIAKFLIEKGADINQHNISYGCTPLEQASFCGNVEIVKLLIEQKCSINAQPCDWTALHSTLWGLKKENRTIIGKMLIEAGADPFLKSNSRSKSYIDYLKDNTYEYAEKDVQELMILVEKYDTLYKKCVRYVKNNRVKFSGHSIQSLVKDIRKNFDLNLLK